MSGAIDPKVFRTVLGHLPTGVCVVTGVNDEGAKWGITIGSVVSVSLDPPLIGFFPGVGSKSWPEIEKGGGFCANVLTRTQEDLCWRFAKEPVDSDDGKFAGLDWTAAGSGSPILPGVVGWIDCDIDAVHAAGDHHFVVGRVRELTHAAEVSDAMVFFRGKVASVRPAG